ncbi:hypothetical protein pb186bvf_001296 [Paramecium bursaria]
MFIILLFSSIIAQYTNVFIYQGQYAYVGSDCDAIVEPFPRISNYTSNTLYYTWFIVKKQSLMEHHFQDKIIAAVIK